MKKVVFLSLNLLWATFVAAQVVNIPDANFKKALVDNSLINTNGDGEIQVSEAVAYTGEIYVYNYNIKNLTGIEAFVNITKLDCSKNSLNSLDLSKNVALTELIYINTNISALDLSNNVALINLYCSDNNISTLNLNNNIALKTLSCSFNSLKTLDVSKNINLTGLNCSFNFINTLDVSKNLALEYLFCDYNTLSNLDVSNNIVLKALFCGFNKLTGLDVSKNTSLIELGCSNNLLVYLNVKNEANNKFTLFDATKNSQLKCIEVDNPNTVPSNWKKDPTASYSSNCMIPTKDISSEGFLQLYPNPSTDSFAFSNLSEAPLSIAIYDLHGKLVQHYPTPASNYNISTLCNGLYIVKAQFATGEAIAKLLKGE